MPGFPIVDLQNIYGAVFVGLLLNTMLTGLEIAQANYWDKDKKAVRFFVVLLTRHLVLNFGNLQTLEHLVWATNLQSILNVRFSFGNMMSHTDWASLQFFPGCAVQLYYVRRLYLLSQSIVCPITVVPITVGSAIFGCVMIAKASSIKSNSELHLVIRLASLWTAATTLSDVFITAMTSWTLYRKRTGFARTDSIIMMLMTYTINSGLLLSLSSTLGVAITISLAVSPSTSIHVAFIWVISYMNSLYAMLNTRNHVSDRSTTDNLDNACNSQLVPDPS
ncbi:hypothetical protein EI94DRAFT_1709440 [Lactarius quietus]|nr:hypothetical protein EI94DRAFT_1709440 [Lactarius quietus]